ncbi:hypothetical protein VTO42DRAFT_1219 [Malbranchea cinnamomea]
MDFTGDSNLNAGRPNGIPMFNHDSEQDVQPYDGAAFDNWNSSNDLNLSVPDSTDWLLLGDASTEFGTQGLLLDTINTAYKENGALQSQAMPHQADAHANFFPETVDSDSLLMRSGFMSVSQWLDGAYCPPAPCSYCRKHRLQCLIIRTTPANPNPVTSCSSCVALYRECSLAQGEKRQPSEFETMSLALGNLHGVTEKGEDGDNKVSEEMAFNNTAVAERERGEQMKSKQFVRNGARILRNWFYQNQEFPYPSEEQKAQLSQETGFSQKRISTWFANARRRQKQRYQASTALSRRIVRAGSPMPTSMAAELSPMERWRSSPTEDEPISEAVIRNAIASTTSGLNLSWSEPAIGDPRLDRGETSSHVPSSVSSYGSRASEASSVSSASSAWSYRSLGDESLPFPLLPTRLRSGRTSRARQRQRSSEEERHHHFQCAFCPQSFKKKHDWLRHEKSVHLPLDTWVCTPDLSKLQQPTSVDLEPPECRFCDVQFPTQGHWKEHEFHICAEKPVVEKSFSRKDYLWQHLRKYHGCTKLPVADLDAWRDDTGANSVRSRCGFCGSSLVGWKTRAEHLARHFKEGSRMEQWEGDWGLDPVTMRILRNAIPLCERKSTEIS